MKKCFSLVEKILNIFIAFFLFFFCLVNFFRIFRFKEKRKSRDFNSGSREYGGRGGFGGKRNFEKGHFFDELENFL